jgi:hypothetical protein
LATVIEPPETRDDSIAELVSRLAVESRSLARDVRELAIAELRARLVELRVLAMLLPAAGALLLLGLLAAGAGAIAALALAMPIWASALVVAFLAFVVGGLVGFAGIRRLRRLAASPEKTIAVLKEGTRWLQAR